MPITVVFDENVDRDVILVRSHCEWIGEGTEIGTMPDGMEADLFRCSRKLPGDAIDQIASLSINFTGRLRPIQVHVPDEEAA